MAGNNAGPKPPYFSPSIVMDAASPRLPFALKLVVSAFLAVMVPVYYQNYGPTNFMYFCDVALLLSFIALWTEHPLPASMAAVGILVPQVLWCADFLGELFNVHLVGLTGYMFDANRSLFLRGLSFFHGWLPFLLVFLVKRLGYDRRALLGWTALGWSLCLIAYFFLPPAGTILADPKIPVNINYVFGFDDAQPQTWLPAPLYLLAWMVGLLAVFYVPSHLVLRRLYGQPASRVRQAAAETTILAVGGRVVR